MKFRARFGFLTANLTFRFWEGRSAEWKERKAKAKVSKGIKQKEDRKKVSKRNRRGRKNEPEMGTSSTLLKLKAKAKPTNRHGIKAAQ